MRRARVYLAQVNHQYGDNVFLPYSVGLLWAFARQDPEVARHYELAEFLFLREPVDTAVARMKKPDVVGISCYIWNASYSNALAAAVKRSFPDCLIVMGGPEIPTASSGFFTRHPYVDILVHNEGERAFTEILKRRASGSRDFTAIPGLTIHLGAGEDFQTGPSSRVLDLEALPSPYLTGVFDELLTLPYIFQASHETHRGCPYSCTFCDWGSAVFTKVRSFTDERLYKEFEWFGERSIELIYNCDANYGMMKRDLELTAKMVDVKKKYGYPQKFRAAYAKKSNERVYDIARLLSAADMSKGVTLSMQSMDAHVLDLIKRSNIKVDDFSALLTKYKDADIATYTEIIIGLPGETYESFGRGLEQILSAGQHDSINAYPCILLLNSELRHPEQVAEHGIQSVRMPIMWLHASATEDQHTEYNDVVVETKTMSRTDWCRMFRLAWLVQSMHCLSLTQAVSMFAHHQFGMRYTRFYEALCEFGAHRPETLLGREITMLDELLEEVLKGGSWDIVIPEFGPVSWPVEEATFLRLVSQKQRFYQELREACLDIFSALGDDLERALDDILLYQSSMARGPYDRAPIEFTLRHDVPEFIEEIRMGRAATLQHRPVTIRVTPVVVGGTLEDFAREVVWYGRKGGSFRHHDVVMPAVEQPRSCAAIGADQFSTTE